jgi:hypothetical protein
MAASGTTEIWLFKKEDIIIVERKQGRQLYISMIIFVVIVIINSVLAKYAAIPTHGVAGVSSIYPAIAFMIIFTLWFGGWGAIAPIWGVLSALASSRRCRLASTSTFHWQTCGRYWSSWLPLLPSRLTLVWVAQETG